MLSWTCLLLSAIISVESADAHFFRIVPDDAGKVTAKDETDTNRQAIPQYPAMPEAVSSFGAAAADGWLYVYGGHRSGTHRYSTESVLGTFHRLNLSDPKKWEALPQGMGLQGLAVVAHEGKIYRIGGMRPLNKPGEKVDNQSTRSCARFDPATMKWENLPDLPEDRSSHDAAVVDDKIVVVGGWNMKGGDKESEWHSTALVLDLKQRPLAWKSVKQPFERRALTATGLNGKIYVIGGITSDDEVQLTVNVYDPAKDVWTTGPNLPGPKQNGFAPASCAAGDRLFASTADGKVVRLTAKGDKWEPIGQLKQPRIVHRMAAASNDLLVVIGGALKGDNIALTETIKTNAAP
jgi:N-acetylneuraminic acid mutarotase